MNLNKILLNLEILSQIKENDKISIQLVPGEKKLFVDHFSYLSSLTRWYNRYNREDSLNYLDELLNNIQHNASYIINGNHLQECDLLVSSIRKALKGLDNLKETYNIDSIISSRLILIIDKLKSINKDLNNLTNNTIESINEIENNIED